MKKNNNAHYDHSIRLLFENLLNEGKTITEISYLTGRDRSGIAKEINKHKTVTFPGIFNNSHPCLKHKTCTVKSYECYLYCKNIEVSLCPKLTSSPHICNGCSTKSGCRYVNHPALKYRA